ncbi:hypothetical protein EUX98_g863 [Antrodiella citrinella]|uniref:Fe2OG dioxygenase domain-containing protein n=1 Tax=Antrodiella citrinella TaxID=2447956 RepID=A0A4S4N4N6_9APHY|nr:hypothetical protein EUX98_g863 [Antrodiella citrinella]
MTDVVNLINHRVPGSHIAYYIPNFVSEYEEEHLIRKILESPHQFWKDLPNRRYLVCTPALDSTDTSERGQVEGYPPRTYSSLKTSRPSSRTYLVTRIRDTGAFQSSPHGAPNHIILNEYKPGQGIMPHEDGPTYHPVVATLSLGSHAVFHYYKYKPEEEKGVAPSTTAIFSASTGLGRAIDKEPVMSLLLEPRSLVITTSDLYTSHLHGIDDVREDTFGPEYGPPMANVELLADAELKEAVQKGGTLERETRYSLTCRDVEKVAARLAPLRR